MAIAYELLGAPTGNCQRVAVALEEAEIPYKATFVDLWSGRHRTREHLRLNPAGKVPVLIERDDAGNTRVISQSNAILLHVARKGAVPLLPNPNEHSHAIALERFMYFVTDVIGPNYAGHVLNAWQQPRQASLFQQMSLEAFELAEFYLADSPYLAGEHYSLADICAATVIAPSAGEVDWERLGNLKTWFDRVTARPGFVRGMQAFRRGA
ncbi:MULTISPECIES: glutathione S-transferase family protein [Burkholderiaceae]|uniref:GST-like protein n=1 Tax=Paraburkholderia bryophila TaxID=420952 RepID=A0A7Z0B965_9BURK|nr:MULTISPECIES: glutathione S-transferase family protein [Burkholderiaceae]NYH25954.1 GST-like protein [Paraburkholderia bryophila]